MQQEVAQQSHTEHNNQGLQGEGWIVHVAACLVDTALQLLIMCCSSPCAAAAAARGPGVTGADCAAPGLLLLLVVTC